MLIDSFAFDMFNKHYIAHGTVAPVLRALSKRIGEIIPDMKSAKVNQILLYDSLTQEFIRRVREGVVAGLIVEEPTTWTKVYESENMVIKRKVA